MRLTPVQSAAVAVTTTVCAGLVVSGTAVAAEPVGGRNATSASATEVNAFDRGRLVSFEHLRTLSATEVEAELDRALFDTSAVTHGIDSYRLVYRTVDPHGRPTTASGLVVLPRGGARQLRTVSFGHGTASHKRDAPSMGENDFASSPAITFASAGFAAVAPDYLGLGVGPGTHPWMDVPSETTASLDMLRAARSFAPSRGRTLRREVFSTGFSQGASAALGLARALQDGDDPWFRLRAVAAISGAYDWDTEISAALNDELDPKLSVAYMAYLLVAFDRLHHLYDAPGEVFQAPYAERVEKLFDGTTPGEDMLAALPGHVGELLTPRGFEMLRHPTGRFAAALRVTDGVCRDWTPRVPVRLYMADEDEQAAGANTHRCQNALKASGTNSRTITLREHTYYGSTHLGSSVTGVAAAVRWFARLH